MRGKIHYDLFSGCITELFLDLRCMSVVCHPICLHILIHFTEQIWKLRPSSCPGGSGFCINDQCIRVDHSLLHKRIGCQNGTGCITSRVGNQSRAFYLITVDLAQPIYCFLDKLWALMLNLVPFFISLHILDTEICAQVNHLHLRENLLRQDAR